MPSFDKVLNQTQMWQVSLLVKNAGSPMPADVTKLIQAPLDFSVPANGGVGAAPGASPQ
jgi:hypothetical protein